MARRRIGRPLLAASIGVATVVYAGCTDDDIVGNLMPADASRHDTGADDASPADASEDGTDGQSDSPTEADAPSDALPDRPSDAAADADAPRD